MCQSAVRRDATIENGRPEGLHYSCHCDRTVRLKADTTDG